MYSSTWSNRQQLQRPLLRIPRSGRCPRHRCHLYHRCIDWRLGAGGGPRGPNAQHLIT
jgi:hypothetical protein